MAETDENRAKKLLHQVNATPGANLRQLNRYTNIPLSSTNRLLDELEADGKIESSYESKFRRIFPAGMRMHQREREVLGYVNRPRPRALLQKILAKPGIRHGDLAEAVNVPAPTTSYYMKQIVAKDLVNVRKYGALRMYRVKNPDVVKRALSRTAKGFKANIAKGQPARRDQA